MQASINVFELFPILASRLGLGLGLRAVVLYCKMTA